MLDADSVQGIGQPIEIYTRGDAGGVRSYTNANLEETLK